MSDLLSIGRSGVLAYQGALATVGENVTNADTVGYAKRAVVLSEVGSVGGGYTMARTTSAFGGVNPSQVSRVWNQYASANAWSANSDSSSAGTRLQYLQSVETALDDGDSGLGTKLTAIFTTASQLASSPTDSSIRQTLIASLSNAVAGIQQTGKSLSDIASQAKTQATTLVDQTNGQLASLAKLNAALHSMPAGTASRAQLEDQRDSLISSISANLGVDATVNTDGSVSLKLSNYSGPILLSATDSSPAYLTLDAAADGRLSINIHDDGQTSAATPTGGVLAGLIDASATIAGRRQQLDGIAAQLSIQFNDWQAQGKTPDGTAGQPVLSGTTAATLAMATTDPGAVAAGSASGSDNGNLLTLSSLRGSDGVEARWNTMVTGQAIAVSTAQTESDAATARKSAADSAVDDVSGISLDNEAADLLRYQQAYTASSKVIQTARQTLQDILDLF